MDDVIFAHKLRLLGSQAHKQPWAWRVGIPVASSGHSGLLLTYYTTVDVFNIYDIVLCILRIIQENDVCLK